MPIESLPVESTLEIFSVTARTRRVVYRAPIHFEAPNWSRDGKYLLVNSAGRLLNIPIDGSTASLVHTGFAAQCNNDHGFSPDGSLVAISDETHGPSRVYVVNANGGDPRLVTPLAPSYWHGWSPDGKTLAYCAGRAGRYDIYSISIDGGEETRLTEAPGLDDGPDFSPDGQHIYFNSDRDGAMRIYRMRCDGTEQMQLTFDSAYGDWFPHPSPDGRYLVFVSYESCVKGHPPNKRVWLRLMSLADGSVEVLGELFGGQGTINVPSWSPDSTAFAFVSYRMLEPDRSMS
jgi:Tol biopolymer transport system component